MNHPTCFLTGLTSAVLLLANLNAAETEPPIQIDKSAQALIPLSISGYTGDVDSTLRYDLEVAGFEIVAPETARFNVSGANNSAVEGRLIERATKVTLLEPRRYSGGTLNSQAHAFADDIVLKITDKPGIARTRIAYKGESGGATEIYVADYDGGNATPVTRDHALVAAPCLVAARHLICYTSYKSGFPDVYAQNLDTGERRAIAKYPGLNSSAAISPDGRRVALILSKSGSPDLYVCDADGSNLKQLTNTKDDEFSPCWAPNGRTICFGSRSGGSPALYTIGADGSGFKRLKVSGAGSSLTEPDWSPDGQAIVFTVLSGSGFQLYMVPAEGGEATHLGAGADPSWAPNSRTLICTRRVNGRQVLSLLDVKTKRFKDVRHNLGNCSQPSWAK